MGFISLRLKNAAFPHYTAYLRAKQGLTPSLLIWEIRVNGRRWKVEVVKVGLKNEQKSSREQMEIT